jgi:hypothetical protein
MDQIFKDYFVKNAFDEDHAKFGSFAVLTNPAERESHLQGISLYRQFAKYSGLCPLCAAS